MKKRSLETIYTDKNEKVRKLDAQLPLLENAYRNELSSVVKRIKNDYDAALRQEKLLAAAYNGQSAARGSGGWQISSIQRSAARSRDLAPNVSISFDAVEPSRLK